LVGSAAKIGLDRIGHRQWLCAVASALRHIMGGDDLGFGVYRWVRQTRQGGNAWPMQ
jgi:hypothetical protein